MGQKFFISFNSADQTKAHWIAWTLKEAGHEVAVHDWEIPAGGSVPLWMNTKLAWADRLIAVISPDYLPARYSPVEWASEIWNDPDGMKGAVIPVIVRPTPRIPPLLNDLRRIDLTPSGLQYSWLSTAVPLVATTIGTTQTVAAAGVKIFQIQRAVVTWSRAAAEKFGVVDLEFEQKNNAKENHHHVDALAHAWDGKLKGNGALFECCKFAFQKRDLVGPGVTL
jgi:TIR domain